jgi:hypothetical protein
LKKPAGSVRFGFGVISKKPKNRTETDKKPEKKGAKPSQNRKNQAKTGKKPSQNRKNRAKLVFALKNRTEPKPVGLTRFQFGFGFFSKKKFGLVTFFDKNRTEPKMITPR